MLYFMNSMFKIRTVKVCMVTKTFCDIKWNRFRCRLDLYVEVRQRQKHWINILSKKNKKRIAASKHSGQIHLALLTYTKKKPHIFTILDIFRLKCAIHSYNVWVQVKNLICLSFIYNLSRNSCGGVIYSRSCTIPEILWSCSPPSPHPPPKQNQKRATLLQLFYMYYLGYTKPCFLYASEQKFWFYSIEINIIEGTVKKAIPVRCHKCNHKNQRN